MPYKKIERPATHDFREFPVIEGHLIDVEHNVGDNKSTVYHIRTESEGVKAVWGSTALDPLMKSVEIDDQIKITFQGDEPSKKRKGMTFKMFTVEVWED